MIVIKYIIGIISGLLVGVIIGVGGTILGQVFKVSGLILVCTMLLIALQIINRIARLEFIKERRNI